MTLVNFVTFVVLKITVNIVYMQNFLNANAVDVSKILETV